MGHRFDPTILREYDIRGTFGKTLHAEDAFALGRVFATLAQRQAGAGQKAGAGRQAGTARIAVGCDGRLSSPALEAALVEGLIASGADVVRIGLGPTPMLYYAEASEQDVIGGIQVTGSHNPADDNGFKMVLEGRPVFGEQIFQLGRMAAAGDWIAGRGSTQRREILHRYVDRLIEGLAIPELEGVGHDGLAALRIGWDAGNGAAGPALELLTQKLPGEHHLLFTQVDGTFPNHHPDPTVEKNLSDLRALVARERLHFGVAFDGDGDRIGVVDGLGRMLEGDQLLMIFAEDLLLDRPGSTIIADVKASQSLFDRISTLGGQPHMWKSGHSLIKSRMKEIGAPLAGELSGHVFFADRFYGYDDALYAGVRLMAATVRLGRSVTELRDAMPVLFTTPELRFQADEARKFAVVDEVRARLEGAGANVVTIDGVRVSGSDGWWLLRASNTQDVLVVRAESDSADGLERLLAEVDGQLALSAIRRV